MPSTGRFARNSDDESENIGMMTSEATTRTPEWAEKPGHSKKTAWWKYAGAAAIFIALLVPAVGYTSSVMLDSKIAQALENAPKKAVTTSAPSMMGDSMSSSKEAAKVDDDDDEEGKPLLLLNGTTIYPGNPMAGKTFEMHDCGNNADEARAKGCSYSVMMQEWIRPECIDWVLAERFLKNGNWTWWANTDADRAYDDVEVSLGNHDVVFVAQSYHRHHCIFAWELLVRSMRTGRPLINKLIEYDHVMHCVMNTLRTAEEGAVPVRGVVAPTAFARCASLDVWMKNLPHHDHSTVDRLLARDWSKEDPKVMNW